MKKILKTGYYVCLVLLGIAAVLLLVSILPVPGNFKVKIVLSGSMEPTIRTGSIVIVKPDDDYKIGDVVTFQKRIDKDPTTHRIEEIRIIGGNPQYITKGDANNAVDRGEIQKEDIVGKVLSSIPYLGYITNFIQKPIGFSLIIVLPAIVVVYDEARKIWREIAKLKNKKKDKEQDKEISELKKEIEDLNDEIKKNKEEGEDKL